LVNLRYKEFEREQAKPVYQDRNARDECYGYAKYWHSNDCGARQPVANPGAAAPAAPATTSYRDWEWRPAFISKGTGDANGASMTYKVNWVFTPAIKGAGAQSKTKLDERGRHEVYKQDVLLAPRCPMVDAYVHPDHVELLDQARTFRQIGKSDWEIEVMLNKSLDDKWNADHKEASDESGAKPPRITVDIIRNYLQRGDFQEANKAGGEQLSKKAISSGEGAASSGGK